MLAPFDLFFLCIFCEFLVFGYSRSSAAALRDTQCRVAWFLLLTLPWPERLVSLLVRLRMLLPYCSSWM